MSDACVDTINELLGSQSASRGALAIFIAACANTLPLDGMLMETTPEDTAKRVHVPVQASPA